MHQTGFQRGERKRRAAFQQQAVDAERTKLLNEVGQIHAAVFRSAHENMYAVLFEFGGPLVFVHNRDVRRDFACCLHDSAVDRRSRAAVADDADRIASAFHTAGEQRIVLEHGADADHDGGQPVARFVHMMAGSFARDPAAVAGVRGNFAVERHRVLERDERCLVRDVVEENLVYAAAFILAHAGFDLDACVAQNLCAFSGHQRIRVQTADEHPANLVLDDRIRARRRASPVAARLKRDVQVGACAVLSAVRERVALGMQAADVLVPAFTDDFTVLDDHAADHRIRIDVTGSALGQRQRPTHIFLFLLLHKIT